MIYFLIILAGFLLWFLWYLFRDNRKYFKRTAARITGIETHIVKKKNGASIEQFIIQSSLGFRFIGYMKIPENNKDKLPVMLLLAGLFTGKDVVDLVEDMPGIEPVIILSIDYPYDGEKRIKWWQLLMALPKIRRAAMNCVRGLFMVLDMLEKREDVDPERIYLTGVSFGSFFGVAAAACDTRIKSVASLFGGGKIEKLAATNLPFKIPVFNNFVGRLAKTIMYPLEPMHYIQYIAPRPLLVVGGESDELFPRECATALYEKAGEPKDLVWFQSDHPDPTNNELIQELTKEVIIWMKNRGLLKEV